MNPIDAGRAIRAALLETATELFKDEPHILVTPTFLGPYTANDVVLIGQIDGAGEYATMSARRSEEWTHTIDIVTYAFRAGDVEADNEAYEAASSYLSTLAEHVRRVAPHGDTTLGGLVHTCRMASFTSEAGKVQAENGTGRMWEFVGKFETKSRVTG